MLVGAVEPLGVDWEEKLLKDRKVRVLVLLAAIVLLRGFAGIVRRFEEL